MAVATVNPAKTETRVVEVTPASVTLTLSPEEAGTLLQICGKIGGDPQRTARKYADAIQYALREAAVKEAEHPVDSGAAIYFRPTL